LVRDCLSQHTFFEPEMKNQIIFPDFEYSKPKTQRMVLFFEPLGFFSNLGWIEALQLTNTDLQLRVISSSDVPSYMDLEEGIQIYLDGKKILQEICLKLRLVYGSDDLYGHILNKKTVRIFQEPKLGRETKPGYDAAFKVYLETRDMVFAFNYWKSHYYSESVEPYFPIPAFRMAMLRRIKKHESTK